MIKAFVLSQAVVKGGNYSMGTVTHVRYNSFQKYLTSFWLSMKYCDLESSHSPKQKNCCSLNY